METQPPAAIDNSKKTTAQAAATVVKEVVQAVAPSVDKLEQNLREAHSELLATARMCAKFKGRLTKANLQGIGESAIECLGQYYAAHSEFERNS